VWSVGVDLERNQLRVHGSGFVLGLTWPGVKSEKGRSGLTSVVLV
jgi:hypothetical protein